MITEIVNLFAAYSDNW